MCGNECGRRIEQHGAPSRKLLELLRSALDAVQALADVETSECDVSGLKDAERIAWGKDGCRQPE